MFAITAFTADWRVRSGLAGWGRVPANAFDVLTTDHHRAARGRVDALGVHAIRSRRCGRDREAPRRGTRTIDGASSPEASHSVGRLVGHGGPVEASGAAARRARGAVQVRPTVAG